MRDDNPNNIIDHDVPSVRGTKKTNRTVTLIGYSIIGIIGVIMLMQFKGEKEEEEATVEESPKNNMPPITIPSFKKDEVKEVLNVPPPPPTTSNVEVEKTLKWVTRKLGGNIAVSHNKIKTSENLDSNSVTETNTDPIFIDGPSPLALQLKATVTEGVSAGQLGNRNFLITKGTVLDCSLITAIDSTVSGFVTCILSQDVYSDNGQVLLLDRGSKLVGEYAGGLEFGQARIFILWTRAQTPNGVVVDLNSSGIDTLGRAGVSGYVDNHFMQRFGSAIMMSLVSDGIQFGTNKLIANSNNGDAANQTISSGQKVVESILSQYSQIKPTLMKNQGDRIAIMVSRDLDFSSVYGLKRK